MKTGISVVLLAAALAFFAAAQPAVASGQDGADEQMKYLKEANEALDHRLDVLEKMVDDLLWLPEARRVRLHRQGLHHGPAPRKREEPDRHGVRQSREVLVVRLRAEGASTPRRSTR